MQVLCIGAHPDDCEGSVGGTAILFRQRGDRVKFVSATDGSRGHYLPEYLEDPQSLVDLRREESIRAAAVGDVEFESLEFVDGEVYVDQASTEAMIRLIRNSSPDLVLMNRPCDYHRDHRYTAQLVLDASYMLTVPYLCPDAPALRTMPVFAYWQDRFTESGAFRADVVVPIDSVIERKVEMMLAHESQYLEWLPYNAEPGGPLYDLPEEPSERRRVAKEKLMERSSGNAEMFADGVGFVEAFQISEYGRRPSESELRTLFLI
ncbi:MAG: PIG-L deacetylase family protein [Fimbriimonas sp.]